MKAMVVRELGQDPTLETDFPTPTPGAHEALIRVRACGVNFADTLMIKGRYQERPETPFAPGMEIAGEIIEAPEGSGLAKGQRVAALCGNGGFAEFAAAPAASCIPLPDAMGDDIAASFQITYGTSHVAFDHRVKLQPGENLLVLGAAGGVGLTAVEIGKLMGANVIACARGAEKLETARAMGADHLIDSETADIRAEVKALGGADVVYDPIGGEQFDAALRACNPEARLLPLGFASGDVPQIPANILLVKNLTVHGFYWGGYQKFRPEVLKESMRTLFQWWEAGRLTPHISNRVSLGDACQALDLLRSRKATGKVVVEID
ncbi:MAG: NADPH:quinone oxidoreductase family protein [Pseudomonadota bacterium]